MYSELLIHEITLFRLSEKFLSFYKMIIDEQQFLILFYWIKYDPFRYISIIMFLHNSIN